MATREGKNRSARLFRDEPTPRVFISSVMTPDLEPVRDAVISALDEASEIAPWAFETSPASSERVVEGYLRKVRDAAFVIWLVGDTTTDPVEAEVGEALAAEGRLLVFVLPTKNRDARTKGLLDRVRQRVRYRELRDGAEIEAEVKAAISDEVARALAGAPPPGKAGHLTRLWRSSHARCIQKWQAVGLPSELAINLAGRSDTGSIPANLLPDSKRPLIVLVGEAGAGKTLACERYIQQAISSSVESATSPIPVFVSARSAVGNLEGVVSSACAGLGDPAHQGARIVIDGADEAGGSSSQLLAEARELVRSWSDAQIVLSTRPMSTFEGIEETVRMPPLTEEASLQIVGIGAGREVGMSERATWSEPIKEATRVPIFALLVGGRLHREGEPGSSRTGLLSEIAEQTTGTHGKETLGLLKELAVRSVEREGTHVPLSELGGPQFAEDLRASRIVIVEGGMAWFPLLLTAQWLAAGGLADGIRTGERLASNPRDLELWRYPLAMLIAGYPHDQVTRVIGPIAEAHPGFLSQIVDESISRWATDREIVIPPAEAGERIRETMPHWLQGCGEMAPFLMPGFDIKSGQLPTLGVGQDGSHLAAGWYTGDEDLKDVDRLPLELFFSGSEVPGDRGWPRIRSVQPSAQSAWAWRWSLEDISVTVRKWVETRRLPVAKTQIEHARTWLASTALLGLPDSHAQPIGIERIRRRAVELQPDADPNLRGYGNYAIDLEQLLQILDRMQEESMLELHPARLEVEPTGRLYIPGSARHEVRRGRITDVYQAALECYEGLKSGLFAGLASFMPIAATLPARLDGHLYQRGPDPNSSLSFEWSLFALPSGERSVADITVSGTGDPEITDRWRTDWIANADNATKSLKAVRPEQSRWLGMAFSGHLWYGIGHLAMEDIVCQWLWSDLTHIKMVKGRLPEAPYRTIP
jgi:hypothetical protein